MMTPNPLQQFNCPRCQTPNPPSASGCQKCGLQFSIQVITEGQDKASKKHSGKYNILFWLVILIAAIAAYGYFKNSGDILSSDSNREPAPKPDPKITASVKFSGTEFIITNKDSFDWTNVRMEINGGIFSGGYDLKHPIIKAGETYSVGALQFADSDGNRFNPFQMKPKSFTVCGDTIYGLACYAGGWN
jgi:hypothetical protein